MLPILISIGPFTLYTLGVVIPIGFFLGLFVIWKRGKELHFEEKELFDVVFITLWWMFVGARIGYALIHFPDFGLHIGHWLNVFGKPGWYLPGGLIAAALAVWWQAKNRKWDYFQVMDILVTGFVLIQAIESLGMFFSGLGYGISTSWIIGMQFPGVFDRRIPVQLWEMISFGLCFVYLWKAESVYRTYSWYKKNRSQAATGFLASVYLLWWGVTATVAALLRSFDIVVFGIPGSVVIPFVVGVIGGGWVLLSRSGISGQSMGFSLLDYFGLVSRKPSRR